MSIEKDIKNIRVILGIFLGFLIVYLLSVLKVIIIPLVLAIYLGLIIQPFVEWLMNRRFPKSLAILVVLIFTFGLIYVVGDIIVETSKSFYENKHEMAGELSKSMDSYIELLNNVPGVHIDENEPISQIIKETVSFEWIKKSSASIASNLGNTTLSFILIIIYLMAALGGIINYKEFITYISSDNPEKSQRLIEAFENIRFSILSYLKVKTVVSIGTGLGFWIVCMIFGVRFAAFWGFLAFILNYIPTVGSIAATLPPFLLGLIEIERTGLLVLFIILLLFIQLLFGNVIEPKMHGSRLALNTVTVLFGLIFWGHLWGAVGLLLSVPLLVLLRIILMQLPNAKMAALLMGVSGKKSKT